VHISRTTTMMLVARMIRNTWLRSPQTLNANKDYHSTGHPYSPSLWEVRRSLVPVQPVVLRCPLTDMRMPRRHAICSSVPPVIVAQHELGFVLEHSTTKSASNSMLVLVKKRRCLYERQYGTSAVNIRMKNQTQW
jgi:hypothetical protein